MNQKQLDAQKVYKCIASCITLEQAYICWKIVRLFYNKHKSKAHFNEMEKFRFLKIKQLEIINKCDN